MEALRPTMAKINLDHLVHNYRVILSRTKAKTVMCVIKADAYGHGARSCMKALKEAGARFFAVSSVYEALDLHNDDPDIGVLILGYVGDEMIETAIQKGFRLCVYSLAFAEKVSLAAKKLGKSAKVHIKINTGMNRIGFSPDAQGAEQIACVAMLEGLELEGIFSHFSSSDEDDKSYTELQFARFMHTRALLREKHIHFRMHHISNTSAAMYLPEYHLDCVRAGIALYGFDPKKKDNPCGLKPVMEFHTRVVDVHVYDNPQPISYNRTYTAKPHAKIATLCVGYADGYNRLLSGKAGVMIHGKKAPVVGRVCMDMMMADVTGMDVKVGDDVVLFGAYPTATELAALCATIDYELLCLVGKRVPRVYYKNEQLLYSSCCV